MPGENLGELFIEIRGRIDGLSKDLKAAQSKVQAWGSKMRAVGGTLTRSVTLPLVALGAAAVNASLTFNKGMANIATLIPGNVARVGELKTAIQDLAMSVGASTDDLSDGMYQVISAFGDTADSVKLLELNAKAARSGVSTVTQAIDLTSAVTKAYGDTSAAAVHHVANLGLLAVRLGQTTFPQLAGSIGKVTGMAQSMGVTQQELFGVFATFTGVIGDAAETSTAFAGVLKSLQKPSAAMSAALTSMGYASGEAAIAALGLNGVLQGLGEYAEKTGTRVADLVTEQEALKMLLPAVGAQAENLTQKIAAMGTEADVLEEAFRAATTGVNAAGFAYDKLKRVGTVAMQELGDAVVTALDPETLTKFTESARKLIEAFGNLTPETKAFIIQALILTAALGPVLTAANGVIIGVGKLGAAFKWLGLTAVPWIVKGLGAVVAALGAVPAAMLVMIAAAAIWHADFKRLVDRSADAVGDWDRAVGRACSAIAGYFSGLASSAISSASRLYSGVYSYLVGRWGRIVSGVSSAIERVKGLFRSLYQAVVGGSIVPEMVTEVAEWMKKLGSWALVDPAKSAVAATQEAFQELRDGVIRTVGDLGTALRVAAASKKLWPEFDADTASAQALEAAITSLLQEGMDSQDPVIQSLNERLTEYRERLEAAKQATDKLAAAQQKADEAAKNYVARAQSLKESLLETGEAAKASAGQLDVHSAALAQMLDFSARVQSAQQAAGTAGLSGNEKLLADLKALRPESGQVAAYNELIAAVEALVAQEHALARAEQAQAAAAQAGAEAMEAATQADILRREALQRLGKTQQLAQEDLSRFIRSLYEAARTALPEVGAELVALANELQAVGVQVERHAAPALRSIADLAGAVFTGMAVTAENAVGLIVQNLDKLGVKTNSIFGRLLTGIGNFFAAGGGPFGIISGIAGLFGLAEGGMVRSSGLALVGERGPEIVNLPTGASVTPLPAAVGAGVQQTIILQLDGRTLARAVVEDFPSVMRLYGAAR